MPQGAAEGGREAQMMLTIWKFDGLQSRCLGKQSGVVKVAGQSSAGRSRWWSHVPTSFRNRERQRGMN